MHQSTQRRTSGVPASILIASFLATACLTSPPPNEEPQLDPRGLLEWNEEVLATAEEEDGFLTLKGLRTVAMMHIAMWDVLATRDSDLTSFLPHTAEDARTLTEHGGPALTRAVHRAAYEIAADSFPDRAAEFAVLYERHAEQALATDALDSAAELGRTVARDVLAARTDDRWNGEAEYAWHPMAPGVYAEFEEHSGTPKGFVFGAGWAQAKPFVLPSGDHFRAPPPPAIDSADYAEAFDEVRRLGARESAERTDDQAHLAMWWKDFAENSHNRLARQLVDERGLDGRTAALLLAQLNLAIYDAYVSVFDNKFHYNHWRPYTAIRWAAHDGNPDTVPDPDWTNLHDHTYAFPSYPSAHGTACAAAMAVLAEHLGTQTAFTMTTATVDRAGPFSGKIEMNPATRDFSSFDEAAVECGLSRLYLGIHFRYDSDEGTALGRKIGGYVLDHTPELVSPGS